MTTTPTASTSNHFSTAGSFARIAAALERHAHLAHARDVAELGDREAHPRRLELVGEERADMLGERLNPVQAAGVSVALAGVVLIAGG